MVVKGLEQKIGKVISKGADVTADNDQSKNWTNFTLRIRKDLLRQIDKSLESRIGLSKTSWILESIQEKLKRDAE